MVGRSNIAGFSRYGVIDFSAKFFVTTHHIYKGRVKKAQALPMSDINRRFL
jgi:hypothetical protein